MVDLLELRLTAVPLAETIFVFEVCTRGSIEDIASQARIGF
ncbi:hypothetical protein V2H45_05770 [Tumidithrix elongata RA019]|uniref:Uncharacterized protein n=1 Tax=Tumidithrix elongata BACA0141 TaxID=2716417 RepID=A0AAW9PXB3_9CYAN|nr:hypothetical protein [Tumidithrix elongata RA019]